MSYFWDTIPIGVITNSGAVLGLGNIGCLLGEILFMKGKVVLSRHFSNVDVFDT